MKVRIEADSNGVRLFDENGDRVEYRGRLKVYFPETQPGIPVVEFEMGQGLADVSISAPVFAIKLGDDPPPAKARNLPPRKSHLDDVHNDIHTDVAPPPTESE